jgi:ribosomal protein S11
MQKQKKNLNYKRKSFNKYAKKMDKSLRTFLNKRRLNNKTLLRVRKIFKHKSYLLNPKMQSVISTYQSTRSVKKICIRVTSNNIFCTLVNLTNKKTLLLGSSGKYSVKTSRKTLKFSLKIVLQSFLEEINNKLSNTSQVILNVVGPLKIRRSVLWLMSKILRNKKAIINVEEKKCFNGCRPAKKKRKKRKGFRIFK